MEKYRLVNYFDVWGNEEDGWEVNNLCNEGEIEVDDTSSKGLLEAVKDFGFFNENATMDTVEVYNDYDFVEFFEKSNNKPLARLELINNGGR